MKTWVVAAATLLLGSAVGAGAAVFQSWYWPWVGLPADAGAPVGGSSVLSADQLAGPQPKVAVDQEKFNFGVIDALSKAKHDFVFANVGSAPLKLTKGDTSCACTLSNVDNSEILPGKSGAVTLQWSAENRVGGFRQVATIFTNDPRRPRVTLTVEGTVKAALRADPDELMLGSIVSGETSEAVVRLYGYLKQPVEITACQSPDPEHFEVKCEPLPPEEVERERDATSGWLIRVSVKSGLPVGPFRRTIQLQTNVKELPTFDFPVLGVITSEISIAGQGWDDRTGVLRLGNIRADEGIQRTLYLRVEGPRHKEVELKPVQIVPDLLQVWLGTPTQIAGGRITLVPLNLEIPKGSRPANYLGPQRDRLGRITIQSNQPHAPELNVYVEFSVQG